MIAPLRIAALVALAVSMTAGSPSASHARSCEDLIRERYKCTATYSNGDSSEFCMRTGPGSSAGDGQFAYLEDENLAYFCTCDVKGRAPNVQFGGSSRDFFCGSNGTNTAISGRISGGRITGQGYNYALSSGLRSSFTCQAVQTCP